VEDADPEEDPEYPAEEDEDPDDEDPDDEDAADGVVVGDCRLLLAEFADWLTELVLDAVWPWKDLAAATETAPVVATAPAIIQRLIREIRASPLSR